MKNNIITIKNVEYEYKNHSEDTMIKALNNISLDIKKGDFTCILGRNGSGKSTMAKMFNSLILPQKGKIYIDSMDTSDINYLWNIRKKIGLIFQNPDNQIIATSVEEDVAFGPENLGVESGEIRKRVETSLKQVGLEDYREFAPHLLSGGQKQRLAIAGILAMHPECIVLDEATAMLDPNGRFEVMEILKKLNKEEKITIIHITHHMREAIEADRVIVMECGKIIIDDTPINVFQEVETMKNIGLDVPQVTELFYQLKEQKVVSHNRVLKTSSAYDILYEKIKNVKTYEKTGNNELIIEVVKESEVIIELQNLSHIYMKGTAYEKAALKNVNLRIKKGEFVGIIGHTGSGKSTLVQHFNGLLKPTDGQVLIKGIETIGKNLKELRKSVGFIFQYPEHQLFEETVYKDIAFGLIKLKLTNEDIEKRIYEAIEIVGLDESILKKSPFELSGGQKRRVAIAGVIVMQPEILILDEPTAGLDPKGVNEIYSFLSKMQKQQNSTIIVISHSMEEISKNAKRILVMENGSIIMDGKPEEIFEKEDVLKKSGLEIPQITKLMKKLNKEFQCIDDKIYSIDRSVEELLKVIRRENA